MSLTMATAFYPLTIADVRQEAGDAVSLLLEVPLLLRDEFRFSAGQHLTLRQTIDGDDVRRSYSICTAPHEDALRVAIKRVAGGLFSSWAKDGLAPGNMIDVVPPHGSFTWRFDPVRSATYVGIAAGSGITPVLSLLKTALHDEPHSRFILMFGNRSSTSILFLQELADLKDRFLDRFMMFHFLTAESDEIELFNGRLNAERITTLLGQLHPGTIEAAFICGPGAMMDEAERAMTALGVKTSNIITERFTADRPSEAVAQAQREVGKRADGLSLEIRIDGRRSRLGYHADQGSILDNAHAAGLPAPFACKAGVCATCRAKLVAGKVSMAANYGLNAVELSQGYVLTCQAVPLGEGVVLDFDG